jgi:putative component of membrane protein insertase Oxa1/YidC/SpoIIIJ protein YidD
MLRKAVTLAIRSYRRLPHKWKRQCLFRESCSAYVLRVAEERGLVAAVRAFRARAAECRPGVTFFFDGLSCDWFVVLRSGRALPTDEMSPAVLAMVDCTPPTSSVEGVASPRMQPADRRSAERRSGCTLREPR